MKLFTQSLLFNSSRADILRIVKGALSAAEVSVLVEFPDFVCCHWQLLSSLMCIHSVSKNMTTSLPVTLTRIV